VAAAIAASVTFSIVWGFSKDDALAHFCGSASQPANRN
jgi:hypothetical protein